MTAPDSELIDAATAARRNAYCRYSNYRVGAALTDEHGRTHVGCNVENASYPEGSCAEANAIAAMVAGGGRKISTIAVIGGMDNPDDCTPCGGCRQRIAEFADANTRIVLVRADAEPAVYTIAELLPDSFHLES